MNSSPTMNCALRFALLLTIAAAFSGSTGCETFSAATGGDTPDKVEPASLELKITSDKSTYQPGEAMIVGVTLTNVSSKPLTLRQLDTRSISFWFGAKSEDRRMQRFPISSRLEREALRGREETGELQPQASLSRQFLVTRLTPETGVFLAQVHAEPYPQGEQHEVSKIYSNAVEYRVEGAKLFERDTDGKISKEDAIKVASADAGGEITASDAMLIEDNMGFEKWYINLDHKNADGTQERAGYLIDPFTGRLWAKAKPFVRPPAEINRAPQPRMQPMAPGANPAPPPASGPSAAPPSRR